MQPPNRLLKEKCRSWCSMLSKRILPSRRVDKSLTRQPPARDSSRTTRLCGGFPESRTIQQCVIPFMLLQDRWIHLLLLANRVGVSFYVHCGKNWDLTRGSTRQVINLESNWMCGFLMRPISRSSWRPNPVTHGHPWITCCRDKRSIYDRGLDWYWDFFRSAGGQSWRCSTRKGSLDRNGRVVSCISVNEYF